MNIGRLAEIQAFRRGASDAVIEVRSQRRRTFAELHSRTRRLANALTVNLGVRKGDKIAVLSKNRIEFLEIYLAAANIGAVTLALNWRLAIPELSRILSEDRPRILFADCEFQDAISTLQSRVDLEHWITWRDDKDSPFEELLGSGSDQDLEIWKTVGDLDPFLVMYTGGTTGTSKGVAHSHRSAFAAMVNNTVAERIVPSDKYLLLGQMFHSACILALNYLNHGCPVVIIDFQPDLALQIIELERVTATLAFPSMAHHMVWAIGSGAHDLSSLRNVQYGGGPMPVNVILEMLRALPCNLIQCYGTTESIGITFLSQEDHLNAMREADSERLTSCGREALLTEVRLLDAKNQWIPPDSREPGELVLRSESNMLGYWNRPDLNRDAWHNDWLRTGDIARWGKDRFLYIVDRAKDIIISGGENIYSSQVEKAIYSHPSVLEAAVIGIPDLLWGESVKAFVVLKPGMGASEADIANAVARELASYQKPRYVEFVEAIPKTPAGKIAKQDLRKRSESLSHVANKA